MTTFGETSTDKTDEWVAAFKWHVIGWRQNNNGKIEYFHERVPVDRGRPMTPDELRYALNELEG